MQVYKARALAITLQGQYCDFKNERKFNFAHAQSNYLSGGSRISNIGHCGLHGNTHSLQLLKRGILHEKI